MRTRPNKVRVYHSFIITIYIVGYCSVNSSQNVIYRCTEDDGGPSKGMFANSFSFQLKQSNARFLNMYLDMYYVLFLLFIGLIVIAQKAKLGFRSFAKLSL